MNLFKMTRVELIASLMALSLITLNPASPARANETGTAPQNEISAESAPQTSNEVAAETSASVGSEVSESESVDLIVQQHPFTLENNSKDPFKPLIEKPKPEPIAVEQKKTDLKPRDQTPPPIKPLTLTVQGICGNEGSRWALITYENQIRAVNPEMVVDGAFKVVAVENDRLIVYSNKHQTRQTFSLVK